MSQHRLHEWLVGLVLMAEVSQAELARRTGLTPKHVNQMLRHGRGSLETWDRLLHAAGIDLYRPPR